MTSVQKYIIVDRKGDCRIVTRRPARLAVGLFVFPLTINIPDAPPMPDVVINMPVMSEAEVLVDDLNVVAGVA